MTVILADDAIPYLDQIFGQNKPQQLSVVRCPGREIASADLTGVDGLLLRTVTQVNRQLLEKSSVRYVATASAGFDHFNLADLARLNIDWYAARGCNARAVAEYVVVVIALLQSQGQLATERVNVGVIGVGHVGSKVAELLTKIGITVICYDPPRQLLDASFKSAGLDELYQCHMLSCHLPLVRQGRDATIGLVDPLLADLADKTVILNAGRGESLSLSAIRKHPEHDYILDVWDSEPSIRLCDLNLKQIKLMTPHIAGYGIRDKYNASCMAAHWLATKLAINYQPVALPTAELLDARTAKTWQEAVLMAYDPRVDQMKIKALAGSADNIASGSVMIESLRKNYALRAPFSRDIKTSCLKKNEMSMLSKLGFSLL
ncbi:Erythronate-4-phosphate dehydrogenase [Piscirickettsia salmonis]|uniref:2-hydroxyacid dehydrogenase n=1 Tax=Piscirickettsia salmonis TaxID=1238 RepID=A0A1L6TAT1_PISSA|nr:NAD(P)-dependent oxidoreductase [Piscirickettsia salmonis]AKP73630.1 hydroxyacid dehydrogenase [Piscirickettsia salmonis LF-89 = ATCC VR-1361]ALB22408.1 2-hydroxyacid dehydrogenase [Piscirickettsia salmonis]ALY02482.1 hydroxyacid dehydrogenase [Piscirickettsia salmonis]AMA42001.1 hydroxyacid dehydrogenase [Piscirickettsia salmonis]AOS34473.1 hydroxyacid dehydrogenase [Piscirickettsia salmonis]